MLWKMNELGSLLSVNSKHLKTFYLFYWKIRNPTIRILPVKFEKAEAEWEPASIVLNSCIAHLKKRNMERKLISTFGL
jgi:hypothetical protein